MKNFIKFIAVYIVQFLMWILRIIPIKKNQIVFISYHGLQYSCNPKYISEYLEKEYAGKFEIIWLLDSPEEYSFLNSHKISIVKYTSLQVLRYAITAKIVVLNAGRIYSWMLPKRNQIHINTWHGGGYYKLCGLSETRREKLDRRLFLLTSKHTTFFLSTNQCFTDNELRHDFYYDGEVLNIGYPRNDIFFHCDYAEIHKRVCSYFGLKEDCKLIMYAPTFRYEDAKEFYPPDFKKLKEAAVKRFGGDWAILTRMHYYDVIAFNRQDAFDANYRPDMPDMQELLVACEMLVSDYSSCIWDYSFTYRPCLLFTPDLDEYTANRGFGIDIYDWGFPVCKSEQDLWNAIENFDESTFRKAMERHHENLGSFEQGNASEIMGKLIYDFCYPKL